MPEAVQAFLDAADDLLTAQQRLVGFLHGAGPLRTMA
jgi:hypothetical protein